jgi:hypothetical protein
LILLGLAAMGAASADAGYPRIANLWGVGPETTDYAKWSRYGMLVMGGGAPQAWRQFGKEMRARNPEIRLLGTAPLMNLGGPKDTPWMKDEWYLRRPDGKMIVWWADQIYAPNLLIDDCLTALVEQTEKAYGDLLRDGVADGVFYDSVVGAASWLGEVDADRDGVADKPADIDARWHERQNLFFRKLREKHPGMLILANDTDMGHAPFINGRLFEGAPLLDRVAGGAMGIKEALDVLGRWMTQSVKPPITFAIMTHPLGWQGWRVGKGDRVTTKGEVERVRRDYRRMRLGLATALMSDAYYAYDFGTVWYGLPLWYAEYDARLGKALGQAQEETVGTQVTMFEWAAGQDPRGLVLEAGSKAGPQGIEGAQKDPEAGWQRLISTDPEKVRLEPGKAYRIEAVAEIVTKPNRTFQFDVRTGAGGWERHDKGILHNAGQAGEKWGIDTTVVPDDFEDYALEWHVLGAGGLRLTSLRVSLANPRYMARRFEGGVAMVNASTLAVQVNLDKPMRRLKDDAAPRYAVEVDDDGPDFAPDGAWQAAAGERHYFGYGYRVAAKPGSTARWTFTAPSTDTYAIFVCVPGGKDLTDAAAYGVEGAAAATINQRVADGGWVKLFEIKARRGQKYEVVLRSGGAGATAADAIRAESAERFNDGAKVESVTLDPMDGIILLSP